MILTITSQAGIDLKPKMKLFAPLESNDGGVEELEVMGLEHFILPFSLLGIGIVLASVVLAIERSIKRMDKSGGAAVIDIGTEVDVVSAYVDEVDIDVVDVDDVDVDDVVKP